ncbi:alpha/beta fold hydrolase [Taklimakanibacter lacteus]|uniref:alpha/beta fold hydrolase n=1 Tax=Taklimakanibacter lacteus TaxID=2268456 RepID=UPI0034D5F95A
MSDPAAKRGGQETMLPREKAGGTSYVRLGQGEPIVFIHGVGLNADAWHPQIEAFASTHQVIALDMAGHGGSALPAEDAGLSAYVEQLRRLLDDLGIPAATIVGHSMGGLVALGFALAHPDRTLRVAVLNSVYERDPASRKAVEMRAREIAMSSGAVNADGPLKRWFGDGGENGATINQVRQWLTSVDPRGYAAAYRIFATSDDAFSGRLGELAMPALFATGSLDPNSTPSMSRAMAKAAPRGEALILEGQRHMMNLVDPDAVNRALRAFLAQSVTRIDPRDLRTAFGSFMTGVTIVTTIDADGAPRGFTANSFTSVSLDPPLLLVCIARAASSCATFTAARGFAVNILAESQKDISGVFASKRADKFSAVAWHAATSGNPLIDGAVAWFDCARADVIDAGDHVILMGAIRGFAHSDANPLGYARGGYVALGLEQAAVNAAAHGGRTVVGAILESEGRLVLMPGPDGKSLILPEAGRIGASGSVSALKSALLGSGIEASLGFLFAVFENPSTRIQSIYYRGDAVLTREGPAVLVEFDAIPWDRLPDEATRIMLKRFVEERRQGRFKIYSGDHEQGEVRAVD